MTDPVNLLWTGGWDSTFRLLQLLIVEQRSVQPIYVIDTGRGSLREEINAMNTISTMAKERIGKDVVLYPTKALMKSDFGDIKDLKDRYEALKARCHIGSQYYWLALIAEDQGWEKTELCIQRFTYPSPLQKIIFDDLLGPQPRLKDFWEAELFKYWSFPVLNITKHEMRQVAEEHGFTDILFKRWFCFHPVGGKCCGTCRPCKLAKEEEAVEGVDFASPIEVAVRKVLKKLTS